MTDWGLWEVDKGFKTSHKFDDVEELRQPTLPKILSISQESETLQDYKQSLQVKKIQLFILSHNFRIELKTRLTRTLSRENRNLKICRRSYEDALKEILTITRLLRANKKLSAISTSKHKHRRECRLEKKQNMM